MAININYGDFSGTGVNGLSGYLNWVEANYSDPEHATTSGFSTADSSSVTVGSTTSAAYVNDNQYAGQNVDALNDPVVSWVIQAGDVADVWNGTGSEIAANTYTLDNIAYSLFSSPEHTLWGNIESIDFGVDWATGGGEYTVTDPHLTISNISDAADNYGLLDTNANGIYDAVNDYTNGDNLTHNIVYGLMGGQGGAASTDALQDAFDDYGTEVEGTNVDEEFDPYNAQDTFILGGGDDLINAGFQVGSGGDVINIDDINSFANAAAAVTAVDYDTDPGNALLTYYEGFTAHTVEITGVSSGLTTDNFVV